MTKEEEFEVYKADFEKKVLKRARAQSIVLGMAAVVAVLGMIYGFINNIEANAQRDAALATKAEYAILKSELVTCQKEVEDMKKMQELAQRDTAELAKKIEANLQKSSKKK